VATSVTGFFFSEPPFKVTQLVVLILFVAFTIAAAKRFHAEEFRTA
jgi:hypothetical protein